MKTRMRTLVVICGLTVALVAGAAEAATLRYFNYEPDSDSARYRTQDVTLVVRSGIFSSRVLQLFRKRAAPFKLHPPGPGFSGSSLKAALPDDVDPRELSLYAVDEKQGAPFANGACKGAARAWLALTPVKADRDLTIFVLTRDSASGALALCETLAYRWRAEWQTSLQQAEQNEELGPSNSH